jgi:hypothetical protein
VTMEAEIYLEPAEVGLLRLGRTMGTPDLPAALIERDALLSAQASRAVDREIADREEAALAQVDDDIWRGELFSTRCYECGGRTTLFGCTHADDCALDRSLNAQQRWRRRNPEFCARQTRIARIKRRWAIVCKRQTDVGGSEMAA